MRLLFFVVFITFPLLGFTEIVVNKVAEVKKEDQTKLIVNFEGLFKSQPEIDFTEIKKVLDYLFKMLGKDYEIQETENSNFIPGRVGKILVSGKEVGVIGEVSPRCLKNWKVDFPVVAVEMGFESLF